MTADRFDELFLLVGRIDSKLDTGMAKLCSHEARITKLEQDRWKFAGFIAGISVALSWFAHDKLPWIVAALTK